MLLVVRSYSVSMLFQAVINISSSSQLNILICIGYVCESGTNMADFAMDVLHGVVMHKGDLSIVVVEQVIQKVISPLACGYGMHTGG